MNMWAHLAGVTVGLLIAVPASASESTVRKDGTGDYLTIQDAIAAATANDTVTVGPGTYEEPFLDVLIPVHVRSELGPSLTIIDGQGTNRIFRFSDVSRVSGFTFVFGNAVAIAPVGGAIVAHAGANLVVENCWFRHNTADLGGALYVTQPGTIATVRSCEFMSNDASIAGGAIAVVLGATLYVDQCRFEENATGVAGGAIQVGESSVINVSGSLFQENTSDDNAGAIAMYQASGTVQTSTFWRNHSPGVHSGTLLIHLSPGTNISRNIFAEDTAGFGLYFLQGEGVHGCNVFWENTRGQIAFGTLAADEVVGNPHFCGASVGLFTVAHVSPAAPSQSACGLLIGAFDVGCETVAIRESSWGALKALYIPEESSQ